MRPLLSVLCGLLFIAEAAAFEFSVSVQRVHERSGRAILTVTRAPGATAAASVDYEMTQNSAAPGADFVSARGTLNWPAGDSGAKAIEVAILQDAFEEEPQDFYVTLSNALGEAIGGR